AQRRAGDYRGDVRPPRLAPVEQDRLCCPANPCGYEPRVEQIPAEERCDGERSNVPEPTALVSTSSGVPTCKPFQATSPSTISFRRWIAKNLSSTASIRGTTRYGRWPRARI